MNEPTNKASWVKKSIDEEKVMNSERCEMKNYGRRKNKYFSLFYKFLKKFPIYDNLLNFLVIFVFQFTIRLLVIRHPPFLHLLEVLLLLAFLLRLQLLGYRLLLCRQILRIS